MTKYERSNNYFHCLGDKHDSSTIKIKPTLSFNNETEKKLKKSKVIAVNVKERKLKFFRQHNRSREEILLKIWVKKQQNQ